MTDQSEVEAHHDIVRLMCKADPNETVPLPVILRMATALAEAGYRRRLPTGDPS